MLYMRLNNSAKQKHIFRIYKDDFVQYICEHNIHQSLKDLRSILEAK